MFSVMIVEDEKPARELIKIKFDCGYFPFYICHEALNGYEALEYYKNEMQPDVILTDIEMPRMNGLELIKEIKSINQKQNFVILSCHESFHYAKQAICLGVSDYLIKDNINSEDLFNVLLQSVNCSMSNTLSGNRADSNFITASETLYKVLNNSYDGTMLNSYFDFFDYGKDEKRYFLMSISIENMNGIMAPYISKLLNQMNMVLWDYHAVACHMWQQNFACIGCLQINSSQATILNQRFKISSALRSVISNVLDNPQVTIGVSSVSSNIMNIRDKYIEAKKAVDYSVFMGKGKTLYYDMTNNALESISFDILNIRIQDIKNMLKCKKIEDIDQKVSAIYLNSYEGFIQYNYLKYINSVLLNMIMEVCIIDKIPYKNIIGSEIIPLDMIDGLNTVSSMCEWFCNCFKLLMRRLTPTVIYSKQVQSILNYINEHYTDDISLFSVAEHFNYSKVYIAHIFKEETGESVNTYITKIRIEKTKILLDTTKMHINEIMFSVGFKTPQDFYMQFKKVIGMSPNKYRDSYN
ncbi:MAG: response regulator transcription factor [Ruminiclostridium sp.]